MVRILVALVAVSALAAGCTTSSLGRSDSQAAVKASIMEAMNGGLVAGELGRGLDRTDRRLALEAEYRALEYVQPGQSTEWNNQATGRSGVVTPAQPYKVGSQDCRQYIHRVTAGGTVREARGTACRNADGSWTPLN